jgi:hypothetical protein
MCSNIGFVWHTHTHTHTPPSPFISILSLVLSAIYPIINGEIGKIYKYVNMSKISCSRTFSSLKELEKISLRNTKITCQSLEYLAWLPKLHHVDLSKCTLLPPRLRPRTTVSERSAFSPTANLGIVILLFFCILKAYSPPEWILNLCVFQKKWSLKEK